MDVSFHHKTPRHKQYLAIPTLLKARTSRRCGETSAVLKDRKRGTENSTGKGWVCYRVASASLSVHLRAGSQPHGWVQGTGLEAWGRAAGLKSAPWRRKEARAKPPLCPAPGPAPVCPRKRRRRRLPRQESLLRGLFRPLRPYPGFRKSDSAEPASLHLLQHTRSARRDYRIAGARLVRCNYLPPLSCAALGSTGTTRRN
ncbi:LOW QUALITY PROTEIN: putative uncharacterized protein encoded by LINC03040 [Balaenoptera acutorostrata]|uniref:Uncharacterized protein n=1 Tax=Balaenoptera acutorostrata TaxID=9767 RepID=A0ABM3UBM8_BALAC|nr:LOW QUALITY PROTEIN: putative uncharacterized protein encoded by LINC03040 [Balaenoptera acutorostrata]